MCAHAACRSPLPARLPPPLQVRNTLRFLLGNLGDFVPGQDSVPYEQLPSMDRYMLARLAAVLQEVQTGYDNFQFYRCVVLGLASWLDTVTARWLAAAG